MLCEPREGGTTVPGTRRESGFLAIIGIAIAIAGAAANPDSPGAAILAGGAIFLVGAVLWLIHYSADLRKEPKA